MISTLSCRLSAARTRCRQLTAAITAMTGPGPRRWLIISGSEWSPVPGHYSPLRNISLFAQLNFYLKTQRLPQLFFKEMPPPLLLHCITFNNVTFMKGYGHSKHVDEVVVTTCVSALRCVSSRSVAPAPVSAGDWRQLPAPSMSPSLSALRFSSSAPMTTLGKHRWVCHLSCSLRTLHNQERSCHLEI